MLFVRFTNSPTANPEQQGTDDLWENVDWENCGPRRDFLQWCADNNITAIPCGPPSNSGWITGYFGDLYLDVPYQKDNGDFHKLSALFEYPDGQMTNPCILFHCLTLAQAKRCQQETRERA